MSRFYIPIVKGEKHLPNFSTIKDVGDYGLYNMFMYNNTYNSISFPELLEVTGKYALSECFSHSISTNASFPKLTSVSGELAFRQSFDYNRQLTTISFPELRNVTGDNAFKYAFNNCSALTSVSFPKLISINNQKVFTYAFNSCTSLTSISFSKLTSNSFGTYTDQFNNMLKNVTGCTVHFPSNLQSVIGSWSDITSGFGGTNTTVLFDLPATS